MLLILRKTNFWFYEYVLRYHFTFNISIISAWSLLIKANGRNLYFYECLYLFAKTYAVNDFFVDIWKQDTDFSRNVHYWCLLLLILLKRYTNADLKICRSIPLHIEKISQRFHIIITLKFCCVKNRLLCKENTNFTGKWLDNFMDRNVTFL